MVMDLASLTGKVHKCIINSAPSAVLYINASMCGVMTFRYILFCDRPVYPYIILLSVTLIIVHAMSAINAVDSTERRWRILP